MESQSIELLVDGPPMRAYRSYPGGPGPYPGVVVAMDGGGVKEYIEGVVDDLARAGYAAIAPDLYHREVGYDKLKDTNILKDMETAIDHLLSQPFVRSDGVGITGFCLGGRVTYLITTTNPHIRAAAIFYGGNSMVAWGEGPSPFERSANITAPVLGCFGEEDQNPSPEDVKKIDAELTRLGKVHEFHTYPGAGMPSTPPIGRATGPEAARDAWEKTLAWFQKHLSG